MTEERIRPPTPGKGLEVKDLRFEADQPARQAPQITERQAPAAAAIHATLSNINPVLVDVLMVGGKFGGDYINAHPLAEQAAAEDALRAEMEACKPLLTALKGNLTVHHDVTHKLATALKGNAGIRVGTYMGQLERERSYQPLNEYIESVYGELHQWLSDFCANEIGEQLTQEGKKMQISDAAHGKIDWMLKTLERAYSEIAPQIRDKNWKFSEQMSARQQPTGGEKPSLEQIFLQAHAISQQLAKEMLKNVGAYKKPKDGLEPELQEQFITNIEMLLHNMTANIAYPYLDVLPHINEQTDLPLQDLLRIATVFSEVFVLLSIVRQQLQCKREKKAAR